MDGIKNAEAFYSALIGNSHDAISLMDKNFKFIYRSPFAYSITGWTAEERYKEDGIEQTHPDDKEKLKTLLKEVLETSGKQVNVTFRTKHKAGHYIWLEGVMTNLLHDENVKGIVTNFRDITERKKFEEQQALFTSIVNLSDDAIISKNLDGIITTWNHGAEKAFGYTAQEIIGKQISILIPPHLQSEEKEILDKIKKGQSVDHYETERIKKNGELIYVSLTISPIKDSLGNIIGASKISRNITERKKAKEQLLTANRLYAFLSSINQSIVHLKNENALLINACKIATEIGKFNAARIAILDAGNRLMTLSRTGEEGSLELLEQYAGMDFSSQQFRKTPTGKVLNTGKYAVSNDTLNDPDLDYWKQEMINNGINSSASFPIRKFGKLIGLFTFLCSEKDFFDNEEIRLLEEVAGDISFALENFENEKHRTRVQESLLNSEANLETIFDTTTTGYVLFDTAFNIISFNQHAQKYANEDLHKTLTTGSYAINYYPEHQQVAVKDIMNKVLTGREINTEASYTKPDGTLTWYEVKFHPVSDKEGKVHGILMSLSDFTERKTFEINREKMTADIVQRNKSLEQFSYIVSHNLRAPVANILGLIAQLQTANLDEDTGKEVRDWLSSSVGKLDDVIKDLNQILNTRRQVSENKQVVNLAELASDITSSIESMVSQEKAVITWDFSGAGEILTVRSYLHSIFFNLISNSIKYRQPDIPPVIKISSKKSGNKIILLFKDNGMGIDLKTKGDQVFGLYKRFHTDKAEGKGMGLYMVKTQVETIGGKISINSEVNKGTEFTIELEP